MFIPIAERIFTVFGDADCRTASASSATSSSPSGVLGDAENKYLVVRRPRRRAGQSLGLTRLPAFVHLRQDTTLVAAAEGWDPVEWQAVAEEVGKAMAWSVPTVAAAGRSPAHTRLAGLNRV